MFLSDNTPQVIVIPEEYLSLQHTMHTLLATRILGTCIYVSYNVTDNILVLFDTPIPAMYLLR